MTTITGTSGNDSLSGADGDIIFGLAGNDSYNFSTGRIAYSESGGSGSDTIYLNTNYLSGGYDFSAVQFYRDTNNNLIMDIDTYDKITIAGQFGGTNSAIETLWLSDGRIIDLTAGQYETHGTALNDSISGIAHNGSANDIIYTYAGNDGIQSSDGDDYIDCGIGDDVVNGGSGNDTYFYGVGYGLDLFSENGGSGNDIIQLGSNISLSDLTFIRDNSNNLIISMDASNQIKVANYFTAAGYAIETLKFSDGSTLDLTAKQYETHGTSGTDSLQGITVNGSNNDLMYGHEGNDTIVSGAGNDYLDGGTGNDSLNGGTGDDTYYYGIGYGLDTFSENNGSGNDIIQLGSGIHLSDLTFSRDLSNNLIISLNSTDQMKISGHFSTSTNAIETLKFSDGSTLDLTTHQYETHGTSSADTINGIITNGSTNDILYGHDGNDTINGGVGDDIIYGGAGLDTMNGGTGADTFVFESASAFGNIDKINGFSMTDGDKLNIADLLIGYTPGSSDIHDFVSVSVSGGNTTIAIDRDGTGSSYSGQSVVTLNAVTGITVDNLFDNNHLITHT